MDNCHFKSVPHERKKKILIRTKNEVLEEINSKSIVSHRFGAIVLINN